MSMLRNRLAWVEDFRKGLLHAIDDAVDPTFEVFPTPDPLKVILKISFFHPLSDKSRDPLRLYLRWWAAKANCDIPVIDIDRRRLQAEVLTKYTYWGDYDGNDTRGEVSKVVGSPEYGDKGKDPDDSGSG